VRLPVSAWAEVADTLDEDGRAGRHGHHAAEDDDQVRADAPVSCVS
jgi:hypothetical protein